MQCEHQYIERSSGAVRTEKLFADRLVRWLYHPVRENAPALFKLITGPASSAALGFFNFDLALGTKLTGNGRFVEESGIDFSETLEPMEAFRTARDLFERKIRYRQCRPMEDDPEAIVSPADARVLTGSLDEASSFLIKDKFFRFEELLGGKEPWTQRLAGGDFAIFRLTPDKYHYNHVPVSGKVVDFYEVEGCFHACNPSAVVAQATPYSKNRRVVTILDTDVEGGTGVGLVAMVEVVALMIGEILQCYSVRDYEDPQPVRPGMFLEKGCPKSLYRPGSSTDILLFEKGRIGFEADLLENRDRRDLSSRFSSGFGRPLVETELAVRSRVGRARKKNQPD